MTIAPLRLISSAIFVALAWPRQIDDPRPMAVVMLAAAILVPPVFYLISVPIISHADPTGVSGFVRNLYEYLPYTVVAGLSIFPLTALEVVVCWLTVSLAMVAVELFMIQRDWITLAGPLWLLLLIGGTAMVSGMSQLQYMIALVRRVTFDPLTGALTRRAGGELLIAQFRHCLLNELPLTVAFVDIDRFKQINDGYGHETGDQILRGVARLVQRGLRQGDALIRWGGEEFLVVLAGTDKEGARLVINRLGSFGFGPRPDGTPVTACFGLAERIADGLKDENELIELADRRMYEAKLAGRNRAVFAHGDVIANVVAPAPVPLSAAQPAVS
ncbi:MAG: GGDEF domain-containing protein [Rhodospirillaceae bacterium]